MRDRGPRSIGGLGPPPVAYPASPDPTTWSRNPMFLDELLHYVSEWGIERVPTATGSDAELYVDLEDMHDVIVEALHVHRARALGAGPRGRHHRGGHR